MKSYNNEEANNILFDCAHHHVVYHRIWNLVYCD